MEKCVSGTCGVGRVGVNFFGLDIWATLLGILERKQWLVFHVTHFKPVKLKFWNFLAYLSLPKAIFLKNATGNKRSTCLILPKRRGTRHNIILQQKRREKTKGIKKRRYKSRPLGGFSLLSTKNNLTFTLSRNNNKILPENKI